MNDHQKPSTSGLSGEKLFVSNESSNDSSSFKNVFIPESLKEDFSSNNESDQNNLEQLQRRIKHPHRITKRKKNIKRKRTYESSDDELDFCERTQAIKLLNWEHHLKTRKSETLKNVG